MRTIQRTDRFTSDGVETTPQGFLRFPVYMGRTGVQIYKRGDGSITRELRPEDEVFRKETMDALKAIPVTNNHPAVNVTPENSKELMVGFGSDIIEKVEKGKFSFQKGYITVTDKTMIADINEGKIEVSLGYDVFLDDTPGVFDGMAYDTIQRNITPNHLAIVDKGRAGSEVRLRFDSDAVMVDDTNINNTDKPYKGDAKMAKLKVGDQEFEVEKEVKDAVEAQFKANDEAMEEKSKDAEEKEKEAKDAEKEKEKAEDKAKDAEEEKEKAEEKADTLEAKLDAANAKLKKGGNRNDSAEIHKLVKERKNLEINAAKVLDEDSVKKMDSIDDAQEIKKMVIKAEFPEADLSSKSTAYINARYDSIIETLGKSGEENDEAGKAFKGNRQSKKDGEDTKTKRQKRQDEQSNQWKKPIGKSKISA